MAISSSSSLIKKKSLELTQLKTMLLNHLNVHILFLILALFFGLIYTFGTPLFWGNDESTHFARVYQLSEGHMRSEFLGNGVNMGYGGHLPQNIVILAQDTQVALGAIQLPARQPPYSLGIQQYQSNSTLTKLDHQKPSPSQTLYDFTGGAVYSLVSYLPAVAGASLARLFNFNIEWIIWIGRLFGLAVYIVCVYFAIKSLQFTRTKWVFFTVALLPMALYQASTITADTMANAVALVLSALFIKATLYRKQLSGIEIVALLASVLLLPIIKPTYLFMALLVLLIPNQQLNKLKGINWLKPIAMIIGLILYIYWQHVTRGVSDTIGLTNLFWQSIHPGQQIHWLLHHPVSFVAIIARSVLLQDNTYLSQFFGWLGGNFVEIPAVALLASFSAIALSFLLIDPWHVSKQKLSVIWAVVLVSILSVFGTLYITFTKVAYPIVAGVQGRYFIPFAPLLITSLHPLSKKLNLDVRSKEKYRHVVGLVCLLVIFSLSLATVKWLYVTRG
jgi:uncharacterized membrane protein